MLQHPRVNEQEIQSRSRDRFEDSISRNNRLNDELSMASKESTNRTNWNGVPSQSSVEDEKVARVILIYKRPL